MTQKCKTNTSYFIFACFLMPLYSAVSNSDWVFLFTQQLHHIAWRALEGNMDSWFLSKYLYLIIVVREVTCVHDNGRSCFLHYNFHWLHQLRDPIGNSHSLATMQICNIALISFFLLLVLRSHCSLLSNLPDWQYYDGPYYDMHSRKILTTQQGKPCYLGIWCNPCSDQQFLTPFKKSGVFCILWRFSSESNFHAVDGRVCEECHVWPNI